MIQIMNETNKLLQNSILFKDIKTLSPRLIEFSNLKSTSKKPIPKIIGSPIQSLNALDHRSQKKGQKFFSKSKFSIYKPENDINSFILDLNHSQKPSGPGNYSISFNIPEPALGIFNKPKDHLQSLTPRVGSNTPTKSQLETTKFTPRPLQWPVKIANKIGYGANTPNLMLNEPKTKLGALKIKKTPDTPSPRSSVQSDSYKKTFSVYKKRKYTELPSNFILCSLSLSEKHRSSHGNYFNKNIEKSLKYYGNPCVEFSDKDEIQGPEINSMNMSLNLNFSSLNKKAFKASRDNKDRPKFRIVRDLQIRKSKNN
ncbi:hypothetical protein SteCoe_9970 [Stentor coeruleus]|uniref:Uncharacterized protein n=1 Tax=Stentor coeruleus TaxID=5963 RepID=A0A1R2CGJ9_9CILI|nr:hypothetical protein SteCoe_9970 [Stentor coeruleus]